MMHNVLSRSVVTAAVSQHINFILIKNTGFIPFF